MTLFKKQLGFSARGGPVLGWALLLAILIVVVLIVAGGVGYYFYKSSGGMTKEAGKIEKQLEESLKEHGENPSKESWEKLNLARSELEDFLKELKNPQICEKFGPSGEREHCLVSVAKNLKDHSVCEKISLESPSIVGRTQGDCYKGVAVVLKDYSICEKIISGLPGECYIGVAMAIGDPSECEKIPPGNKNNCYRGMAANQLDFSICERMSVEEYQGPPEYKYLWVPYKYYCYLDIINKIEDPSKCEEIGPQRIRDQCYHTVAVALKDPNLCEKIEFQIIKDECLNRLNK